MFVSAALSQASLWAQPDCVSNALSGYVRAKGVKSSSCIVNLDRTNLANPANITVPKGTTVILRMTKPHWTETVQFSTATTEAQDQDVAAAILKAVMPNLQVLAASTRIAHAAAVGDPITKKQDDIESALKAASLKFTNAATKLGCLESYKSVTEVAGKATVCSFATLVGPLPMIGKTPPPPRVYDPADTFSPARDNIVADLKQASSESLQVQSLADVASDLKNRSDACSRIADSVAKSACFSAIDPLQTRQDRLTAAVAALEKVQLTLETNAEILENRPDLPAVPELTLQQTRNRTSVITISGTDIIAATSTTLGTVTITWQTQPFVLSTGILLSGLPARSYAITQQIVNGAPVEDPKNPGKYLTQITETDTSPSIVFPIVYGSWRIGKFSRADWENHCWNHCAFLLTGGIGANLTNKTADFAAGPSFQVGSVLLTPSAHFGRESVLTNGFYPNEPLGSNPPSALTTANKWTTHFGMGLTYVIPIP
jgi:hypothetical protein